MQGRAMLLRPHGSFGLLQLNDAYSLAVFKSKPWARQRAKVH